jgi:hypothetical protein
MDHVLDLVTVGDGTVGRFMSGELYHAVCREMLLMISTNVVEMREIRKLALKKLKSWACIVKDIVTDANGRRVTEHENSGQIWQQLVLRLISAELVDELSEGVFGRITRDSTSPADLYHAIQAPEHKLSHIGVRQCFTFLDGVKTSDSDAWPQKWRQCRKARTILTSSATSWISQW